MNKGSNFNYNLAIKPDNKIQFAFYNTQKQMEEFSAQTPLASDSWNHVAVTFDRNTIAMYINGKLDAAHVSKGTPNANSSESLELGRQISQHLWMRGKLDEVKIYARSLAETEIDDEYNNRPVSTAKMVAYYKMDERGGTFVANSSGLSND